MTLPRNVSDALPVDTPTPVGPVVPGTAASDLGKAEGQTFVPGDVGVEMLGVVDDGSVPVPAAGKYSTPRMSATGGGMLVSGYDDGTGAPVPLLARKLETGVFGVLCIQGALGGAPVAIGGDVRITNPIRGVDGASLGVAIQPGLFSRTDTYPAPGDGVATYFNDAISKYYSLQVTESGGAGPTWTVVLQVSLDGVTYTTVITHTNADGSGTTKALATPFPARYYRSACVGLTGGGALDVVILGTN